MSRETGAVKLARTRQEPSVSSTVTSAGEAHAGSVRSRKRTRETARVRARLSAPPLRCGSRFRTLVIVLPRARFLESERDDRFHHHTIELAAVANVIGREVRVG